MGDFVFTMGDMGFHGGVRRHGVERPAFCRAQCEGGVVQSENTTRLNHQVISFWTTPPLAPCR